MKELTAFSLSSYRLVRLFRTLNTMIYPNERGGNERYNLGIGQPAQPALRTRAVPKKDSVGPGSLSGWVVVSSVVLEQGQVLGR